MNLSVIIIVPELEKNFSDVRRAIKSVRFADEVLITPQKFPILDFSEVRNEAMKKAKGDWILFLDSDEEVSPKLVIEIQQQLAQITSYKLPITGFYIKRQDFFLAKWLQHGETAHIKLLRLARKDAGKWVRPVHEVWRVDGPVGEFCEPILHYSFNSIDEMIRKIDYYSSIEARFRSFVIPDSIRNLYKNLYRFQLTAEMTIFPFAKFVQNYFLRLGFLDGIPGFIHAGMMSFHSFLVRGKMLGKS